MQDGEWTEERKEHSGENHGRDDDKTSERENKRADHDGRRNWV